jgi:hypothetical protein
VKIEKPHHISLLIHPVERSGGPIGDEIDAGLDGLDAVEIAEGEPDAGRPVGELVRSVSQLRSGGYRRLWRSRKDSNLQPSA